MENVERNHPISIKGYKYKGQFNSHVSSTCPCMPKFHCAFGKPRHFEGEVEQKENQNRGYNYDKQSRKYLGTKDRVEIDEFNKDVVVYDEYGIKIIYEESLSDMLEIEEELLKIGTYYIS